MGNKSFYALLSLLCIVGMLLEHPGTAVRILHILLCGGAFYYVAERFRNTHRISLLMLLMAALGVLTNPLYLLPLGQVTWIPIYLMGTVLFYLAARGEVIIQVKEQQKYDPWDKQSKQP